MRFVACTYEEHASEILASFNDAIVNSTALYDYKPRTPESMVGWFKTKETGRYPVIGAVDQQARLLGFASYGSFRAWPAYKYSIEHSVYVERTQRRKGVGGALCNASSLPQRSSNTTVWLAALMLPTMEVSRCTRSWDLRMPERSAKPVSNSGAGWIWAFGSSS
jgi:L-amino acid N-acyltransferase YncA